MYVGNCTVCSSRLNGHFQSITAAEFLNPTTHRVNRYDFNHLTWKVLVLVTVQRRTFFCSIFTRIPLARSKRTTITELLTHMIFVPDSSTYDK